MTDPLHIVCPHCRSVNRVPSARLGAGPKCGLCHSSLFVAQPIALTKESFDVHVTRNGIPVVVDFWAPWCGPCRMMAPAYEQAAKTLEPRVRLAKVNTEEEPELAARFGITGIPTMIVFHQGRELARQAGALGFQDIVRWVLASVRDHSS
ncbi:MAG: thioredoxin TrxC [Nitrospira sp.]|nr:thioredoxin TrxC [Nitrospira sp.]